MQGLTRGIFSIKIYIYHFSKEEFLSISILLQRDRFSVKVNIYYFRIREILRSSQTETLSVAFVHEMCEWTEE